MSSGTTDGLAGREAFAGRTPGDTLELLVPWELAGSYAVPPAHREAIDDALSTLRQVLETEDNDPARLGAVLSSLPEAATRPHRSAHTQSPLSTEEVAEYDRYFQVGHVDSEAPALSLVRSLVQSCQVFQTLCACHPDLDAEQKAIQRRGFLVHIGLLQRLFDDGGQD